MPCLDVNPLCVNCNLHALLYLIERAKLFALFAHKYEQYSIMPDLAFKKVTNIAPLHQKLHKKYVHHYSISMPTKLVCLFVKFVGGCIDFHAYDAFISAVCLFAVLSCVW